MYRVLLVLVGACYSPTYPDCTIQCAPGCPDGYHCSLDGMCTNTHVGSTCNGGGGDGGMQGFRKPITIDGMEVAGNFSNFPLLVHADKDPELAARGLNAAKLRFTDAQGAVLDSEIERYVASTGELAAWVRVPNLAAGQNTILYLVYGGTPPGNPVATAVWDTNYLSVFHLNEGPTRTVLDSTANQVGAMKTAADSPAAQPTGTIAGAQQFAGLATQDAIVVDTTTMLYGATTLMVEMWLTQTVQSGATAPRLLDFPAGAQSGFSLAYPSQTDGRNLEPLVIQVGTVAGTNVWETDVGSVPPGVANHLAIAVASGQLVGAWEDGVSMTTTQISAGLARTSPGLVLGNVGALTRAMQGTLDEVKISSIVRDHLWLQTEFANQRANSTMVTIGGEEMF